jgi:hypothetical protein
MEIVNIDICESFDEEYEGYTQLIKTFLMTEEPVAIIDINEQEELYNLNGYKFTSQMHTVEAAVEGFSIGYLDFGRLELEKGKTLRAVIEQNASPLILHVNLGHLLHITHRSKFNIRRN